MICKSSFYNRLPAALCAVLFLFSLSLFQTALSASKKDEFSLDFIEEERALKQLPEAPVLSPGDESGMGDISPDHWAYTAVRQLIDSGLLGGYEDGKFHGDRPVSRYELAAIILKLTQNYNRYVATGKIEPGSLPSSSYYSPETLRRIQSTGQYEIPVSALPDTGMLYSPIISMRKSLSNAWWFSSLGKNSAIQPPASIPSLRSITPAPDYSPRFDPLNLPIPKQQGIPNVLPLPSTPAGLQHGRPRQMGAPQESAAKEETADKTASAAEPEKSKAKETKAEAAASDKKNADKKEKEDKKETEKKDDKKASGKDKDKEKEKKIKIPKELAKLEKNKDIELTEKDAEILQALVDYIQKDIVKGEVKKQFSEITRTVQRNERDIEKLEEENQRFKVSGGGNTGYERTTKNAYDNDADNSGTPWRGIWLDIYSKPRKFDDMTLTSSLYSAGNLKLNFQDLTVNKNKPKNLRMRTLYGGLTSFGASPLTTMGREISGFFTEMSWNDYSLKGAIGTHSGNSGIFINAASLQFNLFNQPGSQAYLTHFSSYNKRYHTYDESQKWGYWGGSNGDEDDSECSYVKLPYEKNSVTSFYTRYPLPIKGMNITTEYAHSTYYRPGYKLRVPTTSELSDTGYGSWDDYFNAQSTSIANGYTTWVPIPNMEYQDDAFFILLDYNNGPLSIFPMGYVHLGPKFVSNYLGLPGFDTSSLGLDLLPIKLQSMEVWAFMGEFKKLEDKYKWNFLMVKGGEIEPMYLDSSALTGTMKDVFVYSPSLIDRLNTRDKSSTIKLQLMDNKITYYMTDDISISGKSSRIKAFLPESCLDGTLVQTKDDLGNIIGFQVGNGIKDCVAPNDPGDMAVSLNFRQMKQEYNLFWRTSKKAELSFDYIKSNSAISLKTSEAGLNDVIDDALEDQGGKSFSTNYKLKYRLTDVSTVEMWYYHSFGRPDMLLKADDSEWQKRVGLRMDMSF